MYECLLQMLHAPNTILALHASWNSGINLFVTQTINAIVRTTLKGFRGAFQNKDIIREQRKRFS